MRDAVLAGDEAAWKVLYESCFGRLFAGVYYRAGRDRQMAEEIVQEAWLVAVRRIRHFDPEKGTFEQWMCGIAENLLRNQRRRWWQRGRREVAIDFDASDARPPGNIAAAEQVSLAMACLSEQYQGLLRAKYEECLSVAEIANRLDATPKAIESMLTRARTAFRKAYGDISKER